MIVQYYSSDFKTTPERNAVLPLDWGKSTKEPFVGGIAYKNKTVVFQQLSEDAYEYYPQKVKTQLTKGHCFIVAAPIFKIHKSISGRNEEVKAILAFDSFTPIKELNISEKYLKTMAQGFADVFSELL